MERVFSADSEIGPRCGIVLSELAPDVELALDLGTGPRLGTNPRSESNINIQPLLLIISEKDCFKILATL